MNELQQKLLTMLNWFHNVCEKENLQYYALGGTALGAIRHNGFIPWDDDIDVGMPRDDYNKLREICSKYNAGQYYIEFPGINDDFVYPFCKVYDKQTTLVENVKG
ncbi:MAG: LicD family protein [Clostridia bacterium]|nr:LicD family protein [Clostridia bacterium]